MTPPRSGRKPTGATGQLQQACPLCGSSELDYEFIVENCPMCSCRGCSLLFLNPQPQTAGQLSGREASSPSGAYRAERSNATSRIRHLISYLGPSRGRILIVGADQFTSEEAVRLGFEVVSWPAELLNQQTPEFENHSFQACMLFCALERASDPEAALKTIRRLLAAGGSLMVIAPVVDSRMARIFGAGWWEFARQTRYYFNADTLQSLLIKNGFGDPIILPDESVVSLQYMRQRFAASSSRPLLRALRFLLSFSPAFLRDRTFSLLDNRAIVMVRARTAPETSRLSVIVPVYNESGTFVELIEALLAKEIEGVYIHVFIVESNSTDGSRDLVLRYQHHPRVTVILEDRPKGKGHAVRTGLAAADGEIVLIQDADLEYDINDYDSLLQPILEHRANFVIGSRHTINTRIWKIRKFNDAAGLAALFNFGHLTFLALFNLIYRQRLSDPFSMFKVFRRDCLYGLTFECNRFDFDFEIVIKLLRKRYRVFEQPINYKARSFTEGKKVTVFRDPITWVRALIKFRNSPLYDGDLSLKSEPARSKASGCL